MKDIALAAGFLALMLLGLYLMVKLAKTMQEMREHKETDCFYIATSNPCVVKRIMEILSDMKALHSDKHYTLSIRQGGEILQMLNSRRLGRHPRGSRRPLASAPSFRYFVPAAGDG